MGGLGSRGWIWAPGLMVTGGKSPKTARFFLRIVDAGADMGLIPPSPATRNPVLRRPPVLEDYINVTSTGGDRAFLVLRADPVGTGVQVGVIWPWR